jgi:hypothetical protein
VKIGNFGAPNITEVVRNMVSLAKSAKSIVRMTFNGVEVVARPGETQKTIIARYHEKFKESEARRKQPH